MARESGSWEGKIESLSHDGLGVGTALVTEGGKTLRRPVFVPYAVPGDVVLVNLTGQQRKYLFGEINAVLKASPQRCEPLCPHFTTCGGCNLEHVSYDEQLRQKAKQVTFLLQRKGVALPEEVHIAPSKQRHNYRWRSRIALRFDGMCIAGFRRASSKDIVTVQQCYIVHEKILELIRLLNASATMLRGLELEVTAVVGERSKVGLLIPLTDIPREKRQGVREFFEQLYARNRTVVGNVFFEEEGQIRSYGQVQEHLTYEVAGLQFSFMPETFIQANIATNETLVSMVLDFLCRPGDAVGHGVLDLYAGIGNLSLPIAQRVKHVVAVEGSATSVQVGTANALRNTIENVTFLHHPVERYLREYTKKVGTHAHYPVVESIVLDPPRTGLTEAICKELLTIAAPTILYVSCDASTLADDLQRLQPKYRIERIAGIDMFPDTPHVETLVLLRRK